MIQDERDGAATGQGFLLMRMASQKLWLPTEFNSAEVTFQVLF
jgi:hypothetical protein